jgi:hypothetical protein
MHTTRSDVAQYRYDLIPTPRALVADWPSSPIDSAAWRCTGTLARVAAGAWGACRALAAEVFGGATDGLADWRLMEWMSRRGWPTRALRVGVVSPGAWSAPFMEMRGLSDVVWFAVPGAMKHHAALTRGDLDALVCTDGDGGITIHAREHPGKESAWYDWGAEPPLSYPAVFPARLDCSQVSLGVCAAADGGAVRTLIELAATLSRHPSRLTSADVSRGRTPVNAPWTISPARSPREVAPVADPVRPLVRALMGTLAIGGQSEGAMMAGTRLAGAWITTTPYAVDDLERAAWARDIQRRAGHEPQTMLRAGAAMLGSMDDTGGFDAILRADRMLRCVPLLPHVDHAAFLSAELQQGAPTSLTVGRLAAGICLVGASMPAGQLHYFLDDLTEDLRFASLLVGRDQDLALLHRIVRELDRARRAETFGLPAPAAAQPVATKSTVQTTTQAASTTNGPAVPVLRGMPSGPAKSAPKTKTAAKTAANPAPKTKRSKRTASAGKIGPAKPIATQRKKAA